MTFRVRPLLPATRSANHRVSRDSGCHRIHSQAISIRAERNLELPALEIPCSRSIFPLRHGVGARPAKAASCRRFSNLRYSASVHRVDASEGPIALSWVRTLTGECSPASLAIAFRAASTASI